MKGMPHYATGDVRDVPIRDVRYALLIARILERMTGNQCMALYVGVNRYSIRRISGIKEERG